MHLNDLFFLVQEKYLQRNIKIPTEQRGLQAKCRILTWELKICVKIFVYDKKFHGVKQIFNIY